MNISTDISTTGQAAVPDIAFTRVVKRYGEVTAVAGVDLEIPRGAFVSLLGPSGCGKTTCLRIMAGFEQPSEGEVFIRGERVTGVPAYRRPVNMVFQHYALFPHLSVGDNVAYGLRQRRPRPPREEIARRVSEALAMVRLSGYERRRSYEMSGGQQQRVALARALVNRPAVLLLDEPLAALDRKLRREMQIELQSLQRDVGITFLLVTHDQEEALSMSDRVCLMREGRIVQIGTPRQLYDEPVDRYVADFVGKSNFFAGRVEGASGGLIAIELDGGPRMAGRTVASVPPSGSAAVLSIRPEQIMLARRAEELPAEASCRLEGRVLNRIFLGEHTEYLMAHASLGQFMVLSPRRTETAQAFEIDEKLAAGWRPEAALVLAG